MDKFSLIKSLFSLAAVMLLICTVCTSCSGGDRKDNKAGDDNNPTPESATEPPYESVHEDINAHWYYKDNILISIFWPPLTDYVNDEQWKLMKDAEIDYILGTGDNIGAKATQIKMLDLCDKYGIGMTVGDDRLGNRLLSTSEKNVQKIINDYKDYPAAKGYYLLDEPMNPNIFYDAYKTIANLAPDSYLHLNFLPYGCYASPSEYMKQMNDWAKLTSLTGLKTQYLMYDLYPFGLQAGSFNRTGFLINANCARIVGLRNNVKTASYIQSVEQSVSFRSPNREETLFEINQSLAFGQKQLSYFTWFTPFERSEPFADGIITKDGKPNPKYEFICELNHYVHTVGKTLAKLDALEVYTTKSGADVLDKVPEDFFAQPTGKEDVLYSFMRNPQTGRNYLMIVNNSFSKKVSFGVKLNGSVSGVRLLSDTTGELNPVSVTDGTVSLELEAGGAAILAMPEDFDFTKGTEWKPETGENLAKHAEIYCDSSLGTSGYYMDNLNDGVKYSAASSQGWQSVKSDKAEIVLDFGRPVSLNRVDLYPAGTLIDYAENMAKTYIVSVSDDGEHYVEKAKVSDYDGASRSVPSVEFDRCTARYVKVSVEDLRGTYTRLCEIEVYDDDGSIPEPKPISDDSINDRGKKTVSYKTGSNIALGKKVIVSSYPPGQDYKGWGWWPDFLVDGNSAKGWTSNVKANDSENSTEYAIVDLGDYFTLDSIIITPLGFWPVDFQVLVSDNLASWQVIDSQTGSKKLTKPYKLEDLNVKCRYIMLKGTKLRYAGADGYLLQFGEVEAYGKPYVDYGEADRIMSYYLSNGGSSSDKEYIAAKELADGREETLTQSKLDAAFRKMLNKIGKKFSDVT